MHKTMFDTWLIKDIFRLIARLFLKLTGWKVVGKVPDHEKFVLIAAPHTSNWDLPYLLACAFVLKVRVYWMGKSQIFSPPFKTIMKWMGGIPVDRSRTNNLVEHTAQILTTHNNIVITVPPEGTRSKTKHWKTGFYHIASMAKVPIVMGYLDYGKKEGGLGPELHPSGDIETDMEIIKAFYSTIKGKFPSHYDN